MIMCTEPLYALRLKTEYDLKFQRFKIRTPIKVLKSVREIGKNVDSFNYDKEKYDLIMISCGQCLQCRLLRVKQRSVMSICESLEHEENSFITLTFGYPQTYHHYRHKKGFSHYISAKKTHFHEWSLETELFINFMKRLRFWYYNHQLCSYLISIGRFDLVFNSNGSKKKHIRLPKEERPFLLKDFKPKKIRCLHCGEYGEKKQRPHHHAILFGFQFPDIQPIYENGQKYYVSEILSKLWPFGIHRIGECTYNSCAYVSRYVVKKCNGSNQDEFYNGRKPEYVTYSTKPVIGANYFIKNYKEITNTQELCVIADKKYSCNMPKSYDNILKKIDFDLYNSMKEKRVTNCLTNFDKLLKSKRSIYTKLADNEKIVMAVLKKLCRRYEQGATNYDEYFKKAKAFGLSTKFFSSEFSQDAFDYLKNKNYKTHIKKSSNQNLLDKYYQFELMRKRMISRCFNVNKSDSQVECALHFYKNMPNPFKAAKRGRLLADDESIDILECIDKKGKGVKL